MFNQLFASVFTSLLAAQCAVAAPSALLVSRNGPVNFTSPVYLINSVAYPNYSIGVAASSSPLAFKSMPIITVPKNATPGENVRWAVGILPGGVYHMHVDFYNGATSSGQAVALPPTDGIQEFMIASFGSNDTFFIESTTEDGAWTVSETVGEQITAQPFTGTPTQLFNIVPYPVASVIAGLGQEIEDLVESLGLL